MEIKAQLNKPYTEKQKMEFIIQNNHKQGYKIENADNALLAWGYSDEELKEQEQEQRAKDFFNTSLGYIKRKVTMTNGDLRDFLFDIKPTLKIGVPIISYNLDGTQNKVLVTQKFLDECERQIYFDFYGSYPTTEENSEVEESEE